MNPHRPQFLALSAACLLLCTGIAQAQLRTVVNTITPAPLLLSYPGSAFAVDLNPAALSDLAAWDLSYLHAEADRNSALQGRGDALFFATPLWFGLSAGMSVQYLRPGRDSPDPSANRGSVSLALAYAITPQLSLGSTLRYVGSSDTRINQADVDLAIQWRPSRYLSFALLTHHPLGVLKLSGADTPVPMDQSLVVAFRPWGDPHLGFELAGNVNTEGEGSTRAALVATLPYVGQAHLSGQLRDIDRNPEWQVSAGLTLNWEIFSVGGGLYAGDAVGNSLGGYALASVHGEQRPGLPAGRFTYVVEIQSGRNPRSLLTSLHKLEKAAQDPRVVGLLLKLGSSGIGMAYAQELRWALHHIQSHKKPTHCFLEAASGSEYYACRAAQHIYMDPAGGAQLLGPALNALFFGDVLKKVGIRADFIRIGKYKSAPEQWTRNHGSAPAREQRNVLLNDVYERLVDDLSHDLKRSAKSIRQLIDRGPFNTAEALQQTLISAAADPYDPRSPLHRRIANPKRNSLPSKAASHWAKPPRVGVVVIDGTIIDGSNVDVPFLDIHMTGSRTVIATLEQMSRDPSIKAIVLRIDSPGGSSLASDQIWRAVRRARRRKPVIASMGAVAASGGYYIAAAADEIWALPSTVTGSIGIFFGKVDLVQLAEKLHIGVEQLGRGKHAGADSLWRP